MIIIKIRSTDNVGVKSELQGQRARRLASLYDIHVCLRVSSYIIYTKQDPLF